MARDFSEDKLTDGELELTAGMPPDVAVGFVVARRKKAEEATRSEGVTSVIEDLLKYAKDV